jgi:hypothetical protein
MKAKWYISGLFFLLLSPAAGSEDRTFQHEFQFIAGVNSHQAFEIEPAWSLMYRKTAGITVGLNFMGQMFDNTHYYTDNNPQWVVTIGQRKAFTALLRPALRFRFPVLRQGGENLLYLNVEPGVFINLIPNRRLRFDFVDTRDPISSYIPMQSQRVSNTGGRTFFCHAKSYLSMDIDNCSVSAGFAYSDFDIYSGWRNIAIEGISVNRMIWRKRTTRTLFLSVGYYF